MGTYYSLVCDETQTAIFIAKNLENHGTIFSDDESIERLSRFLLKHQGMGLRLLSEHDMDEEGMAHTLEYAEFEEKEY